MKVFLVLDKKHPATVSANGEYVSVEGVACPKCGATPLQARGSDCQIATDDRAYEAEAHCLACKRFVGVLRAEMNTLFGLHEDEAVLHGRCRVY